MSKDSLGYKGVEGEVEQVESRYKNCDIMTASAERDHERMMRRSAEFRCSESKGKEMLTYSNETFQYKEGRTAK